MSGGVDSSVTAALLKREGYDVVGITLQLYDQGELRRKGACCAGQDIYDAKRVAEKLGIPHYVLDYESRFRERVIADFADAYARGETPIPCVRCNERVKFADLLATANELGAEALATGHYVRRVEGADGPELHAAVDASRDQSYFLFATTRAQLDFLRFPLGGMKKRDVRALAAELGLAIAEKPDSQDICFVPDGDYAQLVAKLRPDAVSPAKSSTRPAACWAAMTASSISRSASARALGFRAMTSRCSCSGSMRASPRRRGAARIPPYTDDIAAGHELAGARRGA